MKSTGKDLFATGWFGKQYVNKSQSEIVTTLAKRQPLRSEVGQTFWPAKDLQIDVVTRCGCGNNTP